MKKPPTSPAEQPKKSRKGIGGRKSTLTKEKVSLFLVAIENAFTVKEALVQAGIHKSQYDRYRRKSEEFRRQIEEAEMKVTMKARSNIATAISNGDLTVSRWWLERKAPEEFRPQFSDGGDVRSVLAPGTTIILPGSKPHPRIIPEDAVKESTYL